MLKIKFPSHQFRIKEEAGKEWIFDPIRKIWTSLTPEEWVRQNILHYLVTEKKYPASLIAVEKELLLGDLKKRFDILVYRDSKPWMIIECKEMGVPLSELVLKQVLNYNITLQTSFIIITNGKEHAGFALKGKAAESITDFPVY